MGIYLFVIGGHDYLYSGNFHAVAHEWVESWQCISAGAIAMVSSEVSMLILAFMSIERFLLISSPFGQQRFDRRSVSACMFTIWMVGILLAVLPGKKIHSKLSNK